MRRHHRLFLLLFLAVTGYNRVSAQLSAPVTDSLRNQLQVLKDTREQMILKTADLEERRVELSTQLGQLTQYKSQLDSQYTRICEQISLAEKKVPSAVPDLYNLQKMKAEAIGEIGKLERAINLIRNRDNKTSRMLESAREIMIRLNERLAGIEAKMAQ